MNDKIIPTEKKIVLPENVRSSVLLEAGELINGARQIHYGQPKENFGTTAALFSAYLGCDISAADVCHLMALLKIARLRNGGHRDSSVDSCGYMALGAEMSDAGT
tara:strand:+ start:7627 stop:7941 length:315 start_codon:yes stop_codon:yes gene_type:complete